MESELKQLFEAAKKAADAAAVDVQSSPEEDRCIDALKALKKFPVNYQILVSTQVGKRLRQLTKHPRKKIQSLASELVEIWKNIIVEETLKNKLNGSLDTKESLKTEHVTDTSDKKVQRVNSIKVENHGRSATSSSDKRNNAVKVEKQEDLKTNQTNKPAAKSVGMATPKLTSLVYCKDPVRDKIRELLSEALCKVSEEVDDELRDEADASDPYRVAVSVESAMFEKWGRSNGAQKFKYRSIMFNIKDPKNPDFRRKTRSADEPMTTFVTCVNCDNHWKFC
ncbi:hypothetical protein E3N88_12873 [Mikania micrantha]|uniref:TFIIS N-terminal domain-containing protein n=1 Tax=Mikania micrantha TaxID=192012 RepID=A0A5N6P8R7_9ASTR|nr:hypothetical protein E3N88_12873 [Mikania micrantha]